MSGMSMGRSKGQDELYNTPIFNYASGHETQTFIEVLLYDGNKGIRILF